ncbi:MAG: PAS domain S-box protein [Polyangiaceae bacterium]|nr:PAS domain S-box protein [Polyangiaceae bacterium]
MSIPLRVLVVEISEQDTNRCLHELHTGGYEVLYERVTTIEQYVAALDDGQWEVIFVNPAVPGFEGLSALDEVKSRELDTPFILLAGEPFDRSVAVRAMQGGVHDYIRKSDMARVLPAVERALREASVRREWREAELVIRESEERFRLLVEGVRDYALFMLDTEGHVASWNAGAQRLHGYFAAEIIGQPYSCFHPEEAPTEEPKHDLDLAFRRGRVEREGWRVRKDGSKFWAHVIITALHDERGRLRGFSKLTRDITERKRVEMALAERAEELLRSEDALQKHTRILRSVLDSMGEGVVVCDEEGQLLLYNPAAEQMLGPTLVPGEGDGSANFGLYLPDTTTPFPEEDLPIYRAILGESVDGAEIFVRDGRSPLGKYVNVTARPLRDEDGRARGGVAVFRDTTGQRNAQKALQRAQSELRQVIEKIPDGVGIFCREGHFVYVNPALAACLGYDRPEALFEVPVLDLIHPDERERAAARMQANESAETAKSSLELRYRRKDGELVTLEVSPVQSLEFEGAPAYLFVARDVTEQKKMQARLLLADRMASVGTLAAGVAHEINNPLAYVVTNMELVASELTALTDEAPSRFAAIEPSPARDEVKDTMVVRLSELSQTLHEAQEGIERVRQITRDLKTFSRADEERRGAVDVARVLDASINMAWNEIRHRARLVKNYGRVPHVEANEARIGQVFLNLLINAAQAVPEGAADKNEIRVSTQLEGADKVRIDIRDTGTGIAPDALRRIFDPFYTTKPVGVGTGLGLSICHGIVAQLGGEIVVSSELGKGSTFSVLLPVARTSAVAAKAKVEAVRAGRRGRVLVVDDEAMIGAAIRRTLSSEHDVTPLTSAREALNRILAGERYDVVLCDLMMPVMSGMELYDELVEKAPEQAKRIIFLTGGAFTPKGQAFLDQVPNPRLDKPFDNQNLRSMVRERVRGNSEEPKV